MEPIEILEHAGGTTDVKVRQVVKSLAGKTLSDLQVWHIYTFSNGLMESMTVQGGENSFSHASNAVA